MHSVNSRQRQAIHEFHWLPTQHGGLLKTLTIRQPNDLYDTSFDFLRFGHR
jgi:hypothetical protein